MQHSPTGGGPSIDPATLARARDAYEEQREAEDPDSMTPFHDHQFTESEWDAANAAASYAEPTFAECSQSPGVQAFRRRFLGAIAFASYCETQYIADDWAWSHDLREEVPTFESAQDVMETTRFRVGEVAVGISASHQLDEHANPLHVYTVMEFLDAEYHIGAVVDADENHATLYGATPKEGIRHLRNRVAHPPADEMNDIISEIEERKETLANDEQLPENVEMANLPSTSAPTN